jgi:hypothetical protein
MATRIFVWIALVVITSGRTSRVAHAQGEEYSYDSYDGYGPAVELYTDLDIDYWLDLDAYSETYCNGCDSDEDYEYEMESALVLNESGQFVENQESEDYDYTSTEIWLTADPGQYYEAEGFGAYCAFDYWGDSDCYTLDEADEWVETIPLPPNIDSLDPSTGSPGDSGTMTIYGENLLDMGGAWPTVSAYPEGLTSRISSPPAVPRSP